MISFLASIILGINKFFSNFYNWFNDLYDLTGEYISKNIANGKVFSDLFKLVFILLKLLIKLIIYIYKSPLVQKILASIRNAFIFISDFPIVHKFLEIFRDINKIYKKQTRLLLLILFLIFFPVIIATVNLLNNSPSQFFIYIIPIFILILFFESGFFIFIDNNEKNIKTSFFKSLLSPFNFSTIILHFLVYIFISSCLVLILTFIFVLAYQLFILLDNYMSYLFICSAIIIYLILSILFLIIYLNILFSQAFFTVILENESIIQSLKRIGIIINKNILYTFVYYIAFYIFTIILLLTALIYFSDIALQFVITFILFLYFLFAYSFRRVLFLPYLSDQKKLKTRNIFTLIFFMLLFICAIGYIALSTLFLRFYPSISQFYFAWQSDRDIAQSLQTYYSVENGYRVSYPKDWKIYQWNNKSVTFHYNVNNTSSGTISINVDVKPLSLTDYFRLELVPPGTLIQNLETNETITRDVNLSVDGFDAIKYRDVRLGPSGVQYEITYMIRKGDDVYIISFVTVNTIFQQTYSKVFDTMISTFRFLR